MTTEELAGVWKQLVALGPEKVVFTGGEPLLRPDILSLLRDLRAADPDHQVLRCLNTNGTLVTPQLAQDLVGLADEVRVSVDAFADRHDALRGPGGHTAALAALEHLHAVGFEPKALVTVTTHSLPDLEGLLCLLHDRGIARVNLNPLRPIGRARNTTCRVDPSEVRAAVERALARCHPDQPPPPAPSPAPAGQLNCGVGRFLNIMPNGDIYPCHVLTQTEFYFGNIREQDLLIICQQDGAFGRLAALDINRLAHQDPALADARPETCLGAVYTATRTSPVWIDILPPPRRGRSRAMASPGFRDREGWGASPPSDPPPSSGDFGDVTRP